MKVGTWSATATNSIAIAADENRSVLEIQHTAGNPVYLFFGVGPAVDGSGIRLTSASPYYRTEGPLAHLAVNMICTTAQVASGGWSSS